MEILLKRTKSPLKVKDMNTLPPMTYQKITGLVGKEQVVAYVYHGSDSGLSHYVHKGTTKFGTVKFTSILTQETVPYLP